MSDEWILTLGALVLLGLFVFTSNTFLFSNSTILYENEYYITAVSLAQSLVDEAKSKRFDIATNPVSAAVCTAPGSLGREDDDKIGWSIDKYDYSIKCFRSDTAYDDVDDYNAYKRIVNVPRLGTFVVQSNVAYVDPLNPGNIYASAAVSQTFCKRLTVKVWTRGTDFIDSTGNAVRLDYLFSPASE